MKRDRISQTALKVGYALISLNAKDDWAERLPDGLVEMTERLLLASGARGYGSRLMGMADTRWMVRVHEVQDRLMPGQFEGFGHRKLFMQAQVDEAIANGAEQILVVGAGFDTLSLRLAPQHPDLLFVEVDHPGTSAAKARGVEGEGWPPNLELLAADLGRRSLSTVLMESDRWDESRPTVIVAEGLLFYLTDQQVGDLLRSAAASVPAGSRLAFSFKVPDDRSILKRLMRLTGEPFRSEVAPENLPSYLDGTDWELTADADTFPGHGIERYALARRI